MFQRDRARQTLIRVIVETPRWLFLGALFLAPWVYGATPQWVVSELVDLLAAILVLWLGGAALRRMPPAIPRTLLYCVAVILAAGWFMALNPHFRDAGNYTFVAVRAPIPWLPGTVDGQTSRHMMERVTCLLGATCFVCDLSGRRPWRRRIWYTVAITGITLVLFGLLQSAFAHPLFVWSKQDVGVPYFATYYYHGNAGSFINLVLPFVAGLAILTLRRPDAHFSRAVWYPGFFICVAGAFVNLSRAAAVIAGLMCILLLVWQYIGQSSRELLPPRRVRVAYALLVIGAVAGMVAFSGWERPAQKWAMMKSQLNFENKRLVSTEVCLAMLPDAGWHGFGPGTFALVFPHYSGPWADLIPGIWRYAHDDYLQTLIEWGWLSAPFWGVILFGAMAQLFVNWFKRRDWSTADRVLAFISGLALAGVSAHAAVDFPMQIASLQLYAGVCIGLGWGSGTWEGKRSS
jgi:hypothetical protein